MTPEEFEALKQERQVLNRLYWGSKINRDNLKAAGEPVPVGYNTWMKRLRSRLQHLNNVIKKAREI